MLTNYSSVIKLEKMGNLDWGCGAVSDLTKKSYGPYMRNGQGEPGNLELKSLNPSGLLQDFPEFQLSIN